MSVEDLMRWLGPLALLLTVVNFWWVWSNPGRTRIVDIECDVEAHDRRIQSIESEMRHLPSKEDISGLKVQMTELSGQTRTIESQLATVMRTVGRVEAVLRNERV